MARRDPSDGDEGGEASRPTVPRAGWTQGRLVLGERRARRVPTI
jgi:hypothetical protein